MPRNVLSSMVISLALNAAEFTSGLTKSEFEAKKFAKSIEKDIAAASKHAKKAAIALGVAVVATVAAFELLVKSAARFKDIEEITGANAEAMASFAVAAAVGGKSMDEVAQFSVKLTKNLIGVDDEADKAGAALAALQIPIKQFKALKPEEQLEAVAKALAKFSDKGGGKTAVLSSLAKGGAELLPVFKEIEASGGRQVILTQEMIEQADAYADAQARSIAELKLHAQAIATNTLPAITAFIGATKELIKELSGLDTASKTLGADNSVEEFALGAARKLAFVVDVGDGVVRVFKGIGIALAGLDATQIALLSGNLRGAKDIAQATLADLDALIQKEQFSAKLEREIAAGRARAVGPFKPDDRPSLAFDGGKKAKATADGIDKAVQAAQRYLEGLESQLQATQELTAAQKVLDDIRRGKFTPAGDVTAERALAAAQAVDQAKSVKEGLQEIEKARADARQALRQDIDAAAAETKSIQASNAALKDEIEAIGLDAKGLLELSQARIRDAVAMKEQELARRSSLGLEGEVSANIREQIEALKLRADLLNQKSFAEQIAQDARDLQDFKSAVFDNMIDPLTDFITGTKTAQDAFRQFVSSVNRMITQLALNSLKDSLLGTTTGPDFGKIVSGLVSSIFGGGKGFGMNTRAAGGPVSAGVSYWVGELGKEKFVPETNGTIIPHGKSAGNVYHLNVNVLPGASRATADQAAAAMMMRLRRAQRVT